MKNNFTLSAFLILSFQALAQFGGLDNTFDTDGRNTTEFTNDADIATAVAIQADNKLVVAGYSQTGFNNDFAVVRYNTDGTIDITFDTDGKLRTPIGSGEDNATAVAIQTDQKIIVAGNSFDGSYWDFAVVRYNSDGTLDNSFDTDGKVTTDIGGFNDYLNSVFIQTDGKILAAGNSNNLSYDDFTIVRYNSDGSLDNTFSGDGKLSIDFETYNDQAYAVLVDADDKIVVVGKTTSLTNGYDFAVVRLNSDGTFDNTFDTDGIQTLDFSGNDDYAQAATLDNNGKIVVAGAENLLSDWDFALARFNTDGSVDNTFDTDGKLTTDFSSGFDLAHSVFVQFDDKIVATGYSHLGANYDFSLVRYNSNGSLDNTWGTGGMVTTAFGLSNDQAYASLIQPDDRIVAVGATYNGANADFAISRYDNSTIIGVSERAQTIVTLFPNPAGDYINLALNNTAGDIRYSITDLAGKQVMAGIMNGNNTTLDISQLAAGSYFFRLQQATGAYRLIKK